ncbi:hypothetical protein BJ546DRAFT_862443 [Cryomyces antarcticus]
MTSTTTSVPSVAEPIITPTTGPADACSLTSSSASDSDDGAGASAKLRRPKLGSRKSSGTIIIPRDSPQTEMYDEEYDEGDARTMSPRRSSEDIERLGTGVGDSLIEQARALQASLLAIVDRVESVRSEHEKLEGGNKFLQSYIGELMQTSKITSSRATKSKGKGRSVK